MTKIVRHRARQRRQQISRNILIVLVPSITDPIQAALRAEQELWLSMVTSASTTGWLENWCDMAMVATLIDAAWLAEQKKYQLSRTLLNEFCQLLNENISLNPIGVLLAVVEAVTNRRWHSNPQIPAGLFQAVRTKILECQFASPWLYRIFEMVPTIDTLKVVVPQMMIIQLSVLADNFSEHTNKLFGLQKDAILNLLHCGHKSEALHQAIAIPDTACEKTQQEVLALVLRCEFENGSIKNAIESGQRVLDGIQIHIENGDKSYGYTYIETCGVLAQCQRALGDFVKGYQWHLLAYRTACGTFGAEANNAMYYREELTKYSFVVTENGQDIRQ